LGRLVDIGKQCEDGGVIDMLLAKFKIKWGSTKNHLVSLYHFYRYLQSMPLLRIGWCTDDFFEQMKINRSSVCISIRNEARLEKSLKISRHGIPTLDAKLIQSVICGESPNEKLRCVIYEKEAKFEESRNAILLSLALTNAKRAGVYSFITWQLLTEAKQISNRIWQIIVPQSKTKKSKGPAIVNIDKEIYLAMMTCHHKCITDADGEGHLFNNAHGKSLDASALNTVLKESWLQFGGKGDITFTLIRKTLATLSRSADKGLTGDNIQAVSRYMDHNRETGDREYDAAQGRSQALIAHGLLKRLYELPVEDDSDSDDDDNDRSIAHEIADLNRRSVTHISAINCEVVESEDDDDPLINPQELDDTDHVFGLPTPALIPAPKVTTVAGIVTASKKSSTKTSCCGKESAFSVEDRRTLKEVVFVDYIKNMVANPLTICKKSDIVNILNDAGEHFQFLWERATAVQITDMMRKHIKNMRDTELRNRAGLGKKKKF